MLEIILNFKMYYNIWIFKLVESWIIVELIINFNVYII